VSQAEQYKAEDEANKGKVEAIHGLENYCFTMRNTLQEEKLNEKFEGGVKENIEKAVQDALDLLDMNQLAEKEQFGSRWRHSNLQRRWWCSSRCSGLVGQESACTDG
jgi:heat shock protein 1/8